MHELKMSHEILKDKFKIIQEIPHTKHKATQTAS